MKQYLLLLGGFLGFSISFATGLVAGIDIVQILFNAAIGCVVGGLMLKWLAVVIVECQISRKKALMQAAAAANPKGGAR